jgi:cation diffusion facilitator family transporter
MSKFPEPVDLPRSVTASRLKRYKEVVQSAKYGIFVRACIILFELIGVVLINSSSLFLDAISSIMDVVSTIFLIVCIRLAQRPPDEDHPFGHGRYEPFGGLLLALLFLVVGGVMLMQQTLELYQTESHRYIHPLAWIFPAVAMVLLELTYRFVIKTAKKEKSPALAADAFHYRLDGLSSLFATAALLAAAYYPSWSVYIDHFGAISISIFMIIVGLFAARENFHQLMDKIPEQEFFDKVEKSAKQVKGVLEVEKIRIQQYGPDAHVNIDVEVDPKLEVEKAHRISQLVRAEIQKGWPAVRDVTVHIEPFYPNDH